MTKQQENVTETVEQDSLFNRVRVDPSAVAKVGKHVRTGRRWDLTHKELLGEFVIIMTTKTINTKYGEAELCQIVHQGEEKIALMGGQVLKDQLKELSPHLPVCAVIRKPALAYTLLDPTDEEIKAYNEKYNV